jgi:flagellar protein FlgJ
MEWNMSFSIDGISSMVDLTSTTASANNATALTESLDSVSSSKTEEELLEVCKDFASYFIEEVLKEVKENMTMEDEDTDSTMQSLTDYHMDSVIEDISDQLLDQSGNSYIQQLYEQMKRNYNID